MNQSPIYFGFNAPFIVQTTQGANSVRVLPRQVDERLIRNDLLQLLLTSPGDRVMRPTFGAGIRKFIFEQMSATDLTMLKQNIMNVVGQYEKRVTLTKVDLTAQDNNILSIKLYGYFNFDMVAVPTQKSSGNLLVELKVPVKAAA